MSLFISIKFDIKICAHNVLGPCSRKCLRIKTCPNIILGQILVPSRVLDHVLT